MNVICSPRLKQSNHPFYTDGYLGSGFTPWVCLNGLRIVIKVPEARYYWIEVNTHQWKDLSGTAIYLESRDDCDLTYRFKKYGKEDIFTGTAERALDRWLGNRIVGNKKITVYFRLLYEE